VRVDPWSSPSEIGLETPGQTTLDGADDSGALPAGPTSQSTDRISLGPRAMTRLNVTSSATVLTIDRIEDARASIPVRGRTLRLEDGIYSLV
jgi:hypothetical protein